MKFFSKINHSVEFLMTWKLHLGDFNGNHNCEFPNIMQRIVDLDQDLNHAKLTRDIEVTTKVYARITYLL